MPLDQDTIKEITATHPRTKHFRKIFLFFASVAELQYDTNKRLFDAQHCLDRLPPHRQRVQQHVLFYILQFFVTSSKSTTAQTRPHLNQHKHATTDESRLHPPLTLTTVNLGRHYCIFRDPAEQAGEAPKCRGAARQSRRQKTQNISPKNINKKTTRGNTYI